jgi:hypothetical protein
VHSDDPSPRRDLFTNKDADAWCEQFHLLFYVLRMSPTQIAQIDYGIDPEHPEARMVFSWAHEIEKIHSRVDVGKMIQPRKPVTDWQTPTVLRGRMLSALEEATKLNVSGLSRSQLRQHSRLLLHLLAAARHMYASRVGMKLALRWRFDAAIERAEVKLDELSRKNPGVEE